VEGADGGGGQRSTAPRWQNRVAAASARLVMLLQEARGRRHARRATRPSRWLGGAAAHGQEAAGPIQGPASQRGRLAVISEP